MTKKIIVLFIALFAVSCGIKPANLLPDKGPDYTLIDVYAERNDKILTVDIDITDDNYVWEANLDATGRLATVTLRGALFEYCYEHLQRPLNRIDLEWIDDGAKLYLHLGGKNRLEKTERTELGIRLVFRTLEPDMEMVSMNTFGGWMQPIRAASVYKGVDNGEKTSVIKFDSIPAYGTGKTGGKNYLDLYNVKIPAGNIKQDSVAAVNILKDRTRIIFSKPADFCFADDRLTIGKKCSGYSSMFGFSKSVTNGNEAFSCTLTGNPQIMEKTMRGMTAFGMKNVKLFGNGLENYDFGKVYKVETRYFDGMLWLVFIHEPEMKYRTYFSGDKFFVVFYKG